MYFSYPKLRTVRLDGNLLQGEIPSQFTSNILPRSLQSLNFSGNANLTGSLPWGWELSASLRDLYLDNCSLQGQIPANWTLPSGLTTLQLTSNSLSGAHSYKLPPLSLHLITFGALLHSAEPSQARTWAA